MIYALQTLGWLACGIYATIPAFWLIIHPFADFWRRRYRAPLKPLGLIWVVLWLIAWTASAPWRHSAIGPGEGGWYSYLRFLVIPLWAISIYIYFGGRRHFSLNQVIGRTELEPDRQQQMLVTTGLHARMRHPLYAGHVCTMLGWIVLAPTTALAGLFGWALVTGSIMIRFEDAELERRFGSPYREYRSRVPAIFPKL